MFGLECFCIERLASKVGAGLAFATLALVPLAALATPPGSLPFGAYDPNGSFSDDAGVTIEHIFLPWEDVFLPSLTDADAYAVARGRSVLVTIEPWTWTREARNTADFLRNGILSGYYDSNMRAVCRMLSTFESPATVRWGHEMEDPSGQFIWSMWKPDNFITAFRRMVEICRAEAPDLQYMWSPLGHEEMNAYYPGDEYVDVIGLSVFGFQAWEKEIMGEEQSFRSILTPRYQRALAFGKPIVVAELGYFGDKDYVTRWENDVRQDIAGFPELAAVVYFNQAEVYPWPNGFGKPNWQIPMNIVE